jgi:hypothetical protein
VTRKRQAEGGAPYEGALPSARAAANREDSPARVRPRASSQSAGDSGLLARSKPWLRLGQAGEQQVRQPRDSRVRSLGEKSPERGDGPQSDPYGIGTGRPANRSFIAQLGAILMASRHDG